MVRLWPAIVIAVVLLGARIASGQTDSFVCGVSDDADFSARLASTLSKTGPDTMNLAVIYVDFEDDGDYELDANMETVVWERLNDYYVMQSDSLLFFQSNIISTYDPLDPVWTARYPANVYGVRDAVLAIPSDYGGELHQDCWAVNNNITDEENNTYDSDYLGELQSEIVSQIDSVYSDRPNPFLGCDMVVFVYLTAEGYPIAQGVGGFAALNIKRTCFDILGPVLLDPGCDGDAILGFSTIWREAGNYNTSFGSILAHEFGHTLGLGHLASKRTKDCQDTEEITDTTYFGPYGMMRRLLLKDRPFLPMCDRHRVVLGWLNEEIIEDNLYDVEVFDINDTEHGGLVYRIPVSQYECPHFSGMRHYEEYFTVSYRSGNFDDGYAVPGDTTMYRSRGLVIWHIVSLQTGESPPRRHDPRP